MFLWDQDPRRRGGWADIDGYVSHQYSKHESGFMAQRCRPAYQVPSDVAMGPHPPEWPLCQRCAELSGVAGRLIR